MPGYFQEISRTFPDIFHEISRKCSGYAHMEIVVVQIVVKFGGFLVITRDHGSFGRRHQVEILPTDLPELFEPARDLLEPRQNNSS